jgi:hypothetical protein
VRSRSYRFDSAGGGLTRKNAEKLKSVSEGSVAPEGDGLANSLRDRVEGDDQTEDGEEHQHGECLVSAVASAVVGPKIMAPPKEAVDKPNDAGKEEEHAEI